MLFNLVIVPICWGIFLTIGASITLTIIWLLTKEHGQ